MNEDKEWDATDLQADYLCRSEDPNDYCKKCDWPTERTLFLKRVLGCTNKDCEDYYRKKKELKP